jgi:hypothetical protein
MYGVSTEQMMPTTLLGGVSEGSEEEEKENHIL